jgi:hypothetical protein
MTPNDVSLPTDNTETATMQAVRSFTERSLNTPRFSWMNLKQRANSIGTRKGSSGHGEEHKQALLDNEVFDTGKI